MPLPKIKVTIKVPEILTRKSVLFFLIAAIIAIIMLLICVPIGVVFGIKAYYNSKTTIAPKITIASINPSTITTSLSSTTTTTTASTTTSTLKTTTTSTTTRSAITTTTKTTTTTTFDPKNTCNFITPTQAVGTNCLCNNNTACYRGKLKPVCSLLVRVAASTRCDAYNVCQTTPGCIGIFFDGTNYYRFSCTAFIAATTNFYLRLGSC